MEKVQFHTVSVTGRQQLDSTTYEIRFSRPDGFSFQPGQQVSFQFQTALRDYTLLGPADGAELSVCVRHIDQGRYSPILVEAKMGTHFKISEPFGYFVFRPASRPAVFVATGTGIAPFVAFVHAGARGQALFHGVREASSLYYSELFAGAVEQYIPCLSEPETSGHLPGAFHGYVGEALSRHLAPGTYDFYLCGRNEMIRDVTILIDKHFPDSRVFTEAFY